MCLFFVALVVGCLAKTFLIACPGHLNGVLGLVVGCLGWVAMMVTPLASHTISLTFRTARTLGALGNRSATTMKNLESLCDVTTSQMVSVQGFGGGAAALASCCLFTSLARLSSDSLDLHDDGEVIPGRLIGAALPFVFSALTMLSLAHVILCADLCVRRSPVLTFELIGFQDVARRRSMIADLKSVLVSDGQKNVVLEHCVTKAVLPVIYLEVDM